MVDDMPATPHPPPTTRHPPDGLEIVFRPDPTIFDGRFAQERLATGDAQAPIAVDLGQCCIYQPDDGKTSWGGQHRASGRGERQGRRAEYAGRKVEAPLWILPGHADDSVTVHLGYGRQRAGKIGTGQGFNAYALRTAAAPWFATGLVIHPTARRMELAATQHHFLMENRHPVRTGKVGQTPEQIVGSPHRIPLTLYNECEHLHDDKQWGMAIDLNACIGCSACVVACQAENNIPVVGKEQVVKRPRDALDSGRPLLRGQADDPNPATYFQPVPCMHCENAPCELVCPVGATVHSSEASTTWSTTAASARATARTTAPTRCGASISCSSPTSIPRASSSWAATPRSRCAAAA